MNKILTMSEWNNYIYKKKIKLIETIDKSYNLDSSTESIKFNAILKDIIKINIFNISYVAFMTFKFLETSFIPSEIILNVIDVYNDDEMFYFLLSNKKNININDKNYKIDSHNYISNLKYIIKCIIEFVVKIEVSLNIQCLLFTDFINKINDNNDNNKPNIFKIFTTKTQIITSNINPSTSILLLLKLISKISINNNDNNIYNDISNFINEVDKEKYPNMTYMNMTYMNKKKDINKKMKIYLDDFMLDIHNFFFKVSNNNSSNNIYIICTKYILNNVDLIFNSFENIFNILEYHLLTSVNINDKKKVKLSYLKNVIKNIVDIEIDNVKKLFNL